MTQSKKLVLAFAMAFTFAACKPKQQVTTSEVRAFSQDDMNAKCNAARTQVAAVVAKRLSPAPLIQTSDQVYQDALTALTDYMTAQIQRMRDAKGESQTSYEVIEETSRCLKFDVYTAINKNSSDFSTKYDFTQLDPDRENKFMLAINGAMGTVIPAMGGLWNKVPPIQGLFESKENFLERKSEWESSRGVESKGKKDFDKEFFGSNKYSGFLMRILGYTAGGASLAYVQNALVLKTWNASYAALYNAYQFLGSSAGRVLTVGELMTGTAGATGIGVVGGHVAIAAVAGWGIGQLINEVDAYRGYPMAQALTNAMQVAFQPTQKQRVAMDAKNAAVSILKFLIVTFEPEELQKIK